MPLGLLHLLRVVHVVAGSFWFGAALLNVGFMSPTVRALGPAAGGQFMKHIVQVRRLPLAINSSAALTVLSGAILYGWRSDGFSGEWMVSGSGIVFGIGGAAAITAWLLGMIVIGPAAGRLGTLAASMGGGPPSPEIAAELQRLQSRMNIGSKVGVVLVAAATLCMAVGRYA